MHQHFTGIAYASRKLCGEKGIPLSLGHIQQLVAAALGYGTLASYQAASADDSLNGSEHLVIDVGLIQQRANDLAVVESADVLVQTITESLRAVLTDTQVHLDVDEFTQALQDFIDAEIQNDDKVNSQTSMTNGYNPMADMPVEVDDAQIGDGELWLEIDVSGTVTMQQDPERSYWGHVVDVDATMELRRTGKRAFAAPYLRVTEAKLQWQGIGDEDDGPQPEAETRRLARILGITEEEAIELDYAENDASSRDGLLYSAIIEVSPTNDDEVLRKVWAKHGTLSVRIPPSDFDGVVGD